jgi:hypothetical protein
MGNTEVTGETRIPRDGWRMPSTEALDQFVRHGNSEVVDALVRLLPTAIASRSQARRYLEASSASARWLGLSRVLIEVAYSVDPHAAHALSDVLLPIVTDSVFDACGLAPLTKHRVRSSLLASSARAAIQIGRFERALGIVEEGAAVLPVSNETREVRGWLDDVRYEALIRTFRFAEAWETRRVRTPDSASATRRLDELDKMLDDFAPEPESEVLFQPARPFVWSEETKGMIADWLGRQSEADTKLKESFAEVPLSKPRKSGFAGSLRRRKQRLGEHQGCNAIGIYLDLCEDIPACRLDSEVETACAATQRTCRPVHAPVPLQNHRGLCTGCIEL